MLQIKNISFTYLEKPVIQNLSFTINQGQNVALIGESGCGKSTLLKLIYGLYDLDLGEIFYEEKPIFGPKYNLIPGEEYIKYLAQDFDLMPYITVEENVGKFLSNSYKNKKKTRIQELLEMVEMTDFAQTKAQHLSGGQQQRVALARVLALEPKVLLLDEPFSQIDNFKKNALRRNLFQYLKKKQITCIIATHDATDALSFSDETLVMQRGTIVAQNHPKWLFENPESFYVASLFGEVNVLDAHLLQNEATDLEKPMLVYPFQLQLGNNPKLEATVKQCFFKGRNVLIKAVFQNQVLFFEHYSELERESKVQLILKK